MKHATVHRKENEMLFFYDCEVELSGMIAISIKEKNGTITIIPWVEIESIEIKEEEK